MKEILEILEADRPDRAVRALERRAGHLVRKLDRLVGPATRGRPPAIRNYVRAWRQLRDRILEMAREAEPDSVAADERGRLVIKDVKGRPAPWLTSAVDQGALQAPFSPWVARYGKGQGVALHLLSEVRRYLPKHYAFIPAGAGEIDYPDIDERTFRRFERLVFHELTVDDPLEAIAETFGLKDSELGRLFRVTRQAVQQWMENGIPETRLDRIHTVQQIADIVRTNLKPERIPAVVRTPAPAYGGRSLLEAIKAGEEEEALAEVRRTFDWAATA